MLIGERDQKKEKEKLNKKSKIKNLIKKRLKKTRGKFMRYIENSSNCCLLTVIFIELVLLFVVIFV